MDERRTGSLLIDRAVGTVIGGAMGDALGAGYEFATAPGPDEVAMLPGTLTEEPAGHWTDDTAMAIAILEVAARMGTLTTPVATAAVGARFLEWFESGPRDVGTHTRWVLSRATSGANLAETAAEVQALHPSAAGNGSLMRTGPVALVHRGDDEQLAIAATLMSELTHPHPDAVQRVRDAVGEQRVDPRPRGKNLALPHAPRGRIAVTRGGHIATQLSSDLRECAETRHGNSVAADRGRTSRR